MKKTITFLFVTITSLLLFSSCDKNKDQEKEFTLVDKVYATLSYGSIYEVWEFRSPTEVKMVYRKGSPNGGVSISEYGTYNLDYPFLFVTIGDNKFQCEFVNEKLFKTEWERSGIIEKHEFYLVSPYYPYPVD